jgi:hypothetical protein
VVLQCSVVHVWHVIIEPLLRICVADKPMSFKHHCSNVIVEYNLSFWMKFLLLCLCARACVWPSKAGRMSSLFFYWAPLCLNPFTASCENAMTLSVSGVPASCEKFPHSSQLNFRSTESIFDQFSAFLKTLNALCVCLQYEHPRSMKRVIRSDNPVTLLLLFWSHKCDRRWA